MSNPIQLNCNASLVFGIGDQHYQRVLETIPNASRLALATYSLPTLWTADVIGVIPSSCAVEIVMALPGFDGNGDWFALMKKALARIADLDSLIPGRQVSMYFCDHNHSKALITDHAAYVGSANFTFGSRRNFEAGVCTTDPVLSEKIYLEYFRTLVHKSKHFSGVDHIPEAQVWHLSTLGNELLKRTEFEFDFADLISLRQFAFVTSNLSQMCSASDVAAPLITSWVSTEERKFAQAIKSLEIIREHFGSVDWNSDFNANKFLNLRASEINESTCGADPDLIAKMASTELEEEADRQAALSPVIANIRTSLAVTLGELRKLHHQLEE